MDELQFDRVVRSFGTKRSRRDVVAALFAVGATLVSASRVEARKKCRDKGEVCRKGDECCSGVCAKPSKTGRSVCAPGPKSVCTTFECGDHCCPPEAVACATLDLAGGAAITCQCPRGYEYVNGECVEIVCPLGTNCAGLVTCGNVSTADLCCSHPQRSFCSCQSPVTGGEVVGCCTPGVDCPSDLGWNQFAGLEEIYDGPCVEDGVVVCCCATDECLISGGNSRSCENFQ